MNDYSFKMPWPPSVNVWKTPFRNRMILTKKGREYRIAALERLKELGLNGEKIGVKLSVSLVLHAPTARRYDIDNFCKSLFDALTNAGFWEDDELVFALSIRKGEKIKGGCVDVNVTILTEQ